MTVLIQSRVFPDLPVEGLVVLTVLKEVGAGFCKAQEPLQDWQCWLGRVGGDDPSKEPGTAWKHPTGNGLLGLGGLPCQRLKAQVLGI